MFGSMVPVRKRFPGTFSRLENEVDRFWNPFDRFLKTEDWDIVPQEFAPRANVSETDDVFEVTVELPGMKAEEVMVEFRNGMLWITGEMKEEKEEKEEKGRTFHRIERSYGKFHRMIDLPGFVKEDEIDAEFCNGILKIVIPKSEEVKPRQIKIKAH